MVKRLPLASSGKSKGVNQLHRLKNLLRRLGLNTVCEAAHCPNLWECFTEPMATFMILGNVCTRNCRFCSVVKGRPRPVDETEAKRLAMAVQKLGLKHVLITSVTRDDLGDGGASHFFSAIREVRTVSPEVVIEVLVPDFQGRRKAIEQVVEASPDIVGHNLETVPSLYGKVRPGASYERSLGLLKLIKILKPDIHTKSSLMLGLGEEEKEILSVMEDLREAGCDILTLGQYLQPSSSHLEIDRFIPPSKFEEYKGVAENMGFLFVASSPFVRSSYKASEFSSQFIRRSRTCQVLSSGL